jgi:hypothetical protein
MATKEEWDFGQRALQKSRDKITSILNDWDYEKNGEPTPTKLSKLIPMSIVAVRRHYSDFLVKINEINQMEQNRLNEIELQKTLINKGSQQKNENENKNET